MEIVLVGLVVASGAVLVIAMGLRGRQRSTGDSDLHRGRAAAEAEMEEHDIDDMLDAIAERRRRPGRRDIGEELADELMRGRWEKE
jgi:hypothetical protein